MAGKALIDLELETAKEWRRYYENPRAYAEKIKHIARKRDKSVRVILFGSVVKGTMKPNSDIDVLIVTNLAKEVNKRLKLRMEIAEEIGECTPFEIHIVTPEEHKNWYEKFIDKYIEI